MQPQLFDLRRVIFEDTHGWLDVGARLSLPIPSSPWRGHRALGRVVDRGRRRPDPIAGLVHPGGAGAPTGGRDRTRAISPVEAWYAGRAPPGALAVQDERAGCRFVSRGANRLGERVTPIR